MVHKKLLEISAAQAFTMLLWVSELKMDMHRHMAWLGVRGSQNLPTGHVLCVSVPADSLLCQQLLQASE